MILVSSWDAESDYEGSISIQVRGCGHLVTVKVMTAVQTQHELLSCKVKNLVRS